MGIFKIPSTRPTSATTPAILFRDLKHDPSIKFLWGHQEKTLDSYAAAHLGIKGLGIRTTHGNRKNTGRLA